MHITHVTHDQKCTHNYRRLCARLCCQDLSPGIRGKETLHSGKQTDVGVGEELSTSEFGVPTICNTHLLVSAQCTSDFSLGKKLQKEEEEGREKKRKKKRKEKRRKKKRNETADDLPTCLHAPSIKCLPGTQQWAGHRHHRDPRREKRFFLKADFTSALDNFGSGVGGWVWRVGVG